MTAEEIIARLIDSKAINGEEAICLLQNITPKEVFVPFNQVKEFGAHDNPYSPVYPQPSFDVTTTTINGTINDTINVTFNTTASTEVINEEVIVDAWIARDKNNCIYIHLYKPIKDTDEWRNNYSVLNIKEHLFPEIKWEDDKPTKVKLIIKKV